MSTYEMCLYLISLITQACTCIRLCNIIFSSVQNPDESLLLLKVDWDGYTIGYYGRIFEARNKTKGGSFEVPIAVRMNNHLFLLD